MPPDYLTNGTIKILLVNICVIVTALYVLNLFGSLRSFSKDERISRETNILCAITYALTGIAVMQFPLFPNLEWYIDLRMAPLILCGYYHGAKTGTLSCIIVFAYRYWLGGEETPIATIYLLCGVVSSYVRSLLSHKTNLVNYVGVMGIGVFFLALVYLFVYLYYPVIFPMYMNVLIPRTLASVFCILLGASIANSGIQMNAIQDELRFYASTDVLSGLHNRRYFDERLRLIWRRASENNEVFSVALIDIDHFKRFNDSYGHNVGDQLIAQISHVIQSSVGSSDIVARYGGEEFAVLLPGASQTMAKRIFCQMLSRVTATRFSCFEKSWNETVTISVGIATYPTHGLAAGDIMANADEALYFAKNAGRNQVIFYRQSSDELEQVEERQLQPRVQAV